MAWIESHQSLGRHPKTKATARALGISRVQLVGHLHYLWWWALDFAEDGDLSQLDPADIAEEAMWEDDPQAFIDGLIAGGFLTDDLQISDWADYTGRLVAQRESNRERQRRYRERHRDESVSDASPNETVTVTSPLRNGATVPNRTKQNQTGEANASPKRARKPKAAKVKEPTLTPEQLERFERWYQHYPRKENRAKAEESWAAIDPDDALVDTMIATTKAYAGSEKWSEDGGKYIPHPATWLNNARWNDEPPKVQPPANVTHFQNTNRRGNGYSSAELLAMARGENS